MSNEEINEFSKKLRDLTGHGIFTCKKCFIRNNYNFEISLEELKNKSVIEILVNVKKMMNNDIQESYCSFEVSKLLKEKGFDMPTVGYYYPQAYQDRIIFDHAFDRNSSDYGVNVIGITYLVDNYQKEFISAPTHALAIEWIRVNFNIFISVAPRDTDEYVYLIFNYNVEQGGLMESLESGYKTPSEVTEAGLLYCLKHLINETNN